MAIQTIILAVKILAAVLLFTGGIFIIVGAIIKLKGRK